MTKSGYDTRHERRERCRQTEFNAPHALKATAAPSEPASVQAESVRPFPAYYSLHSTELGFGRKRKKEVKRNDGLTSDRRPNGRGHFLPREAFSRAPSRASRRPGARSDRSRAARAPALGLGLEHAHEWGGLDGGAETEGGLAGRGGSAYNAFRTFSSLTGTGTN